MGCCACATCWFCFWRAVIFVFLIITVALGAIYSASTSLGQQHVLGEKLHCPSGFTVKRLEQLQIVSGVCGFLQVGTRSGTLLPQQACVIACLSFSEDVEAVGIAEVLL